jgi:predicted nucleotidyltransferase
MALPLPEPRVCRRSAENTTSVACRFFGSAVRGELQPSSDIDESDPSHRPDLVELQEIEDELSQLCHGRPVDLVNPKYLNPRLRDRILREAVVQYEG